MINEFLANIVLAIVQGIAEWIPISSSSHLVLVGKLLGYDISLQTSVALHFGTLMAVFVYFGKDIVNILRDLFRLKFKSEDGKLGVAIIIATIPAGIIGFFLRDIISEMGNNLRLIAIGLAITSIILFIGSISRNKNKDIGYGYALFIGCVQILSLFRGISRSGSTISTALLLGMNEKNAVKFSFLLSIPIIFGANILSIGNNTLPSELFIASFVSFLVGLCMIHFSFKYILSDRKNLRWFALFVLLEAIVILISILF
ncbi:MAG: undecaprenyl-diphosphate phosphatase [Nanoarchaeota archaeon]